MDKKAEFLKIWTERVQRDYTDALLAWLERETDFFEAPASSKHHGAHPGGLLEHSLNVYHRLRAIVCLETYGEITSAPLEEGVEETVAILGLLHDVCKVGVYHTETRRRKNPATGFWEDYQAYVFRDPLPLGHGEKSVYLIQRHMDLEPEEAMAIRWHMGAYDSAVKGGARDMGVAMNMTPWVWRLQQADMCACSRRICAPPMWTSGRNRRNEKEPLQALRGGDRRPEGSGGPAVARPVREDHLRQVRPPALRPAL